MTLSFIFSVVYFYFPGGMANIGAVIGKYVPVLNKLKVPVDFGIMRKGKRLVGDHKVWGSFVFGVIFGTSIGVLKWWLLDGFFENLVFLNLSFWSNFWLYFLVSFGAVGGDIVKSIAKRMIGVKPHVSWIPFDEIDHSLVAMLLVRLFFGVSWSYVVGVVVVFFFLHILFNLLGYLFGIKKVPY